PLNMGVPYASRTMTSEKDDGTKPSEKFKRSGSAVNDRSSVARLVEDLQLNSAAHALRAAEEHSALYSAAHALREVEERSALYAIDALSSPTVRLAREWAAKERLLDVSALQQELLAHNAGIKHAVQVVGLASASLRHSIQAWQPTITAIAQAANHALNDAR